MKRISLFMLIFIVTVVMLASCTNETTNKDPKPDENNDATTPIENQDPHEVDESEVSPSDFFLPNGSKAHYKGDRNEFAELAIAVTAINDNYVVVDENNGGALIRQVYEIQSDKIVLLSKDAIDLDEPIPSVEEVAELAPLETYLQKPFKTGMTFEDWTIIETGATVETPYHLFENAVVIEMEGENFINRKYFVQDYGEIKRESIMTLDDGVEFTVTSTLESVE